MQTLISAHFLEFCVFSTLQAGRSRINVAVVCDTLFLTFTLSLSISVSV